ncbi:MAG: LolA family protein, partial [Candidatus Binataceae bacterium]
MDIRHNCDRGRSPAFCVIAAFGLAAILMTLAARPAIAGGADVASAAQSDLKKVLGKIQTHYDKTKTLRAKFDETLTRPGAPERQRNGTIYFNKPG